ncbi:MAG TPA: hypothetical protein PLO05_03020 [Bacteroidales bacterium]|nr:hypothetical protein [Bacteroidales bacterium]
MKKIIIVIGILLFALALTFCSNKNTESEKLTKMLKKYNNTIKEASNDGEIDYKEAEKINKIDDEICKFLENIIEERDNIEEILEELNEIDVTVYLYYCNYELVKYLFGEPEADAKKMVKMTEKYANAIKDAVSDDKIDDKEAEKINGISKELEELSKELEEKYKEDDEGMKAMEEAMEESGKDMEKDFEETFSKLWDCEGVDKLEW